ncbi:MAG TPA: PEP-CTERM sorting domain-containing protein [Gemmataceae bacterium]|nr:PEP-CTERM sorting domain-containing protein [Gemmataceae bacterium]
MKRSAHRIAVAVATILMLVAPCAQATNLVSNGEFSQFTQGGPNEFLADNNFAPDAKLLDWSNDRPFVAVYAPNSSELIGAIGPSYSGSPITLWGPLNGSNNGFTDTSPNQATDPTANFIAMDGDPGFFGTGISQTISTPLVMGQQYTLSYYWGASQDFNDFGPTHSGWTVMLGTQQLVDGNTLFASIPSEGFSGWMNETVTFTYSGGPTDLLQFLVVSGPASLPPIALLDSVSLQRVPEPTSVLLMGLGLLAMVGVKLWHRRRHAMS